MEHGRVGTPSAVIEDLSLALTRGVEELTRPVDAIKHQAKTVTVGISRSDETLLAAPLVQAVLDAGAPRDRLSYRTLRKLAALDPAVDAVTGFTRYRVDGDVAADLATISVVDRGGIGRDLVSRTERNSHLRGTKRRIAVEREVTAARGRSDGRTLVFVPEVKGSETTGITLAPRALGRPVARCGGAGGARRIRPVRRARRRGDRDRAELPRRPVGVDRRGRSAD